MNRYRQEALALAFAHLGAAFPDLHVEPVSDIEPPRQGFHIPISNFPLDKVGI
jgi:hypothetical protein